jgi:tetratricopeptide (TPR) repeat protein
MSNPDLMYDEAIALKDKGNIPGAVEKLLEIEAIAPTHSLTHSALSIMLQKLGRFDEAIASLKKNPLQEPLAPENEEFPEEVRNIMFRTRKGRNYRAIFLVMGDEVRILRIRGAGQDTLRAGEL